MSNPRQSQTIDRTRNNTSTVGLNRELADQLHSGQVSLPNFDLRSTAKSDLSVAPQMQPGQSPYPLKEGFDILRLLSPPIEQFNDDFYCGLCSSKLTISHPLYQKS